MIIVHASPNPPAPLDIPNTESIALIQEHTQDCIKAFRAVAHDLNTYCEKTGFKDIDGGFQLIENKFSFQSLSMRNVYFSAHERLWEEACRPSFDHFETFVRLLSAHPKLKNDASDLTNMRIIARAKKSKFALIITVPTFAYSARFVPIDSIASNLVTLLDSSPS